MRPPFFFFFLIALLRLQIVTGGNNLGLTWLLCQRGRRDVVAKRSFPLFFLGRICRILLRSDKSMSTSRELAEDTGRIVTSRSANFCRQHLRVCERERGERERVCVRLKILFLIGRRGRGDFRSFVFRTCGVQTLLSLIKALLMEKCT